MKNILTLVLVILSGVFISSAYSDDSIPTATDLREIVVESERGWVKDGVYNFIPSKKEKQLSASPGDLIEVMNLPILQGSGDNITTRTGEPVAIFINGQPASATDIATFWPKEVKKVEYMQNPSGAQYAGLKNVVNFVVSEYEVGGVTRLKAIQHIPNNGRYTVSGKLVFRRMTYGTLLNYGYDQDKPSHTVRTALYKGIFYNGTRYDRIDETESLETRIKNREMNFAFNATYATDKFRAVHTLGLRWKRDPGSVVNSVTEWSENLFDSDRFESFTRNRELSPQLTGNYYAMFSDKWQMGGVWRYAYSDNDDYSWSRYGEMPRIENIINEKVNTLGANVYLNYYLSDKLIFQFDGEMSEQWFKSVYSGSNNEKYSQSREDFTGKLYLYWYPARTLSFILGPGLIQTHYGFSSTSKNYMSPYGYVYAGWNPTSRFKMNLGLQTSMQSATASATNPILIKSSELLWLRGNELLKPQVDLNVDFSIYYAPSRWLSLSWTNMYYRYFHCTYDIYEAAPQDMGGYIRTTMNAPTADYLYSALNASANLFNRKLSISVSPVFRYNRARGAYARTLRDFSYRASVAYMVGNCYLSLNFQSKNRSMDPTGSSLNGQADQISIGCRYGYRNWNISASTGYIFHSKFKTWSRTFSDVYSTSSNQESTRSILSLIVNYTFGYGKKVDKSIDIDTPTEIESSRYQIFDK